MVTRKNNRMNQKSSSLRQMIWNYMRRNRVFVIGDLMVITDAKYKYIREMMSTYEKAGYIKIIKKESSFTSTQIKFVKCTGVKAPAYNKDISTIYDPNTKEEIDVSKVLMIEKVLNSLKDSPVSKEQIADEVNGTVNSIKNQYAELVSIKILKRTSPVKYDSDGNLLFIVDFDNLQKKREELSLNREEKLLERKRKRKEYSKLRQKKAHSDTHEC